MLQSENTRHSKQLFKVVGPVGQEAFISWQELVSKLDETGYIWRRKNKEIVVFFPSGTLELEVIY